LALRFTITRHGGVSSAFSRLHSHGAVSSFTMAHLRLLHTRNSNHGFTVSVSLEETTIQLVYIYNAVGNHTFRHKHITVSFPLRSILTTWIVLLFDSCVVMSELRTRPLRTVNVLSVTRSRTALRLSMKQRFSQQNHKRPLVTTERMELPNNSLSSPSNTHVPISWPSWTT
jgi:hypothetical protein